MYELKTIAIKSSARVWAFVFAILYLFFAVISFIAGKLDLNVTLDIVAVFVGMIIAGAGGALIGGIIAWFYNTAARTWGGLQLDFDIVKPQKKETRQVENTDNSKKE